MPFIQHQLNGSIVSHYPLEERLTIGRSPENDISIDDATVSAEHAVIEACDAGYLVRDLDSTNGIFLNGQRLASGTNSALTIGDVLLLGTHDLALIDELPSGMEKTLRIKKSWIPGVYFTEK